MRKETRQKVDWQSFRPAKGYVAHDGVACGLGLLFPSPVGVRIARGRVTELKFGSSPEGTQTGRGDGLSVRWRRKPKKRSSHRLGAVAIGRDGYRRGRGGGRSRGPVVLDGRTLSAEREGTVSVLNEARMREAARASSWGSCRDSSSSHWSAVQGARSTSTTPWRWATVGSWASVAWPP